MKEKEIIRVVCISDAGFNKAREIEMLKVEEQALEMIVERRAAWFRVKKNCNSPLYDYMSDSTKGYIRELKSVRQKIERLMEATVADGTARMAIAI